MNPILIFYLLLAAFLIWILSARLFPKIGDFIKNLFNPTKDNSGKDEENEKDEQ